jgi:DNA-binding PadR family transcriptional regulator
MEPVPTSHLPLSEATFYILLSLAPARKHGYAILKDVEQLSEGRVTLSTSTLYNALGRLLEQGLIQRMPNESGDGPGLPRKVYALTADGRRALQAELNRLQTLVTTAQQRLSEVSLWSYC